MKEFYDGKDTDGYGVNKKFDVYFNWVSKPIPRVGVVFRWYNNTGMGGVYCVERVQGDHVFVAPVIDDTEDKADRMTEKEKVRIVSKYSEERYIPG